MWAKALGLLKRAAGSKLLMPGLLTVGLALSSWIAYSQYQLASCRNAQITAVEAAVAERDEKIEQIRENARKQREIDQRRIGEYIDAMAKLERDRLDTRNIGTNTPDADHIWIAPADRRMLAQSRSGNRVRDTGVSRDTEPPGDASTAAAGATGAAVAR